MRKVEKTECFSENFGVCNQIVRDGGYILKKILVVEDDKIVRDELLELLNHADYEGMALEDFSNSREQI